MQKKGILAIILGLLMIGLVPAAMAATSYDTTENRDCGTGLGQSNVHLGFNDYKADQNAKVVGKLRDVRPWFKNILRGKEGVRIFSRLDSWQECAAE